MMDSLQLKCRFCGMSFSKLIVYLNHLPHHRHITSYFPCGIDPCKVILQHEAALRLHLIRQHAVFVKKTSVRSVPSSNSSGKYMCSVPHCSTELDTGKNLNSHLVTHIKQGLKVLCPYRGCHANYSNVNSFLNHIYKCHKTVPVPDEPVTNNENCESAPNPDDDFVFSLPVKDNLSKWPVENIECDLRLKRLAQLFMKLEFEKLVPESTVDFIAKEIMSITQENYMYIEEEVRKNLKLHLDPSAADSISKEIFDSFKKQFHPLRSKHLRKKFYKTINYFVTPKLAKAKSGAKYYYVSISDTIIGLFKDKSNLHFELDCPAVNESDILKDFTDGFHFKNHMFFQQNPRSISIIIYQDGFQVVCPIGPAKKKFKFIGIYLSIGNLPDFLRTHPDSIFLIALVNDEEMDHKKVYGKIVELKLLETVGVFVPGYGQVKASLVYVSGDNLGQHQLGGFYATFGTIYFCRLCYVDRPAFQRNGAHYIDFPRRTPEEHDNCLKGETLHHKKGVKFNSVFNELANFHVCDFGLVSCAAHDLEEGICAVDMVLFMHYFVSQKWFTYEEFEVMRQSFPYSVKDNRDRPIEFLERYEVMKGGAMQIFNAIRLLPLIIKNDIVIHDKVWKCFLLLSEIVDIVLAPAIRKSYLGYLHDIILEYLDLRKECFPAVPLRPKHHYLTHNPFLFHLYGPLKKVWTMRFESKHQFFKRSIKSSKNFINPLKSLSLRHELFQCYLRSGARDSCTILASSSSEFDPSMYSTEVQCALAMCGLPIQVEECASVNVKGTNYQKGDILALHQTAYQCEVQMGKILLLLSTGDRVFFVVEVLKSEFIHHLRSYKLGPKDSVKCVEQTSLLSYYAHHVYKLNDGNYVKLHHGLVI